MAELKKNGDTTKIVFKRTYGIHHPDKNYHCSIIE